MFGKVWLQGEKKQINKKLERKLVMNVGGQVSF